METKEQLVKCIQEWVMIDNEIKTLQKELNVRKKKKQTISKSLMESMSFHGIDCFSTKTNGDIIYCKKNVTKPLTQSILLSRLKEYYSNDPLQVSELNQYILDGREKTMKETILRKQQKQQLHQDNI